MKQTVRVLDYMREHGAITQLDALNDLGVMRLASRISDLRKEGYNIKCETVAVKNRYGETCHVARYQIEQ